MNRIVELYRYQEEAVGAVCAALLKERRALVDMATSLGKTIVAGHVMKRLRPRRILYTCHDGDILDTAREKVAGITERSVGRYEDDANITFETLQWLYANLANIPRDAFDLIVVDESHRGKAPTYEQVIKYFTAPRLGMTATVRRHDGKDIEDLFGPAVVSISLEEAVVRQLLNPFIYIIKSDGMSNTVLRRITSDLAAGKRYTIKDVNNTLFIKKRDAEIVAGIIREMEDRQTFVFCRNITHAQKIAEEFRAQGALVQDYHSDTPRVLAKDALPLFEEGNIKFLIVVAKANEGVDIQNAEGIVFLRGTESETVFRQQLGRGLRKKAGKRPTLVLDYAGNIHRLLFLRELADKVREKFLNFGNSSGPCPSPEAISISGDGFEFAFDDIVVEALKLLRHLSAEPYPTWQEASESARRLSITSLREYVKRRFEDPRLPGQIYDYPDFPGAYVFFGVEPPPEKYKIWQEASVAAIGLGIKGQAEYQKRYSGDPKLPACPNEVYPDFPGFDVFLQTGRKSRGKAKNIYSTYEEARDAARKLGIKTMAEYGRRFREDCGLVREPWVKYRGMGWSDGGEFLGSGVKVAKKTNGGKYPTWQEASAAAQRLRIKTSFEYRSRYKEDPRLGREPSAIYPDYPGANKFFRRE